MRINGLWEVLKPAQETRTLTQLALHEGWEVNRHGAHGFIHLGIDIRQLVLGVTPKEVNASAIHLLEGPIKEFIKAFGFYYYTLEMYSCNNRRLAKQRLSLLDLTHMDVQLSPNRLASLVWYLGRSDYSPIGLEGCGKQTAFLIACEEHLAQGLVDLALYEDEKPQLEIMRTKWHQASATNFPDLKILKLYLHLLISHWSPRSTAKNNILNIGSQVTSLLDLAETASTLTDPSTWVLWNSNPFDVGATMHAVLTDTPSENAVMCPVYSKQMPLPQYKWAPRVET
ncbi:hypothetical protein FA15DRAFT_660883 [Coprinopsis marcescibilis]|uniref:Uncharacterized protein n=1 Tax=Coprinopsis marcescibilis TaxID=230819 RepID=A0A5C3KDW4_COPMA|nr:hypothetical protein FA15DRAFT_660883 [Coprinopsis marcescibilis]